ncbi:hypothetical protein ACSNOH_02250 [Streptomyces sp. URMC 127]
MATVLLRLQLICSAIAFAGMSGYCSVSSRGLRLGRVHDRGLRRSLVLRRRASLGTGRRTVCLAIPRFLAIALIDINRHQSAPFGIFSAR